MPGQFEELFEGVHLAVPQRVGGLVIGAGEHQREVGFAQDRRPEHLVARGHAGLGQGQNVEVDDIEQAAGEARAAL